MKRPKCIALLKLLSEKDIEEFYHYLKSRHNKKEAAIQVFIYLKKLHPKFEKTEEYSPEYVFRTVFPKEKYLPSSKKISNLYSDLSSILETFLITNKIENEETLKNIFLLEILRERGDSDLFKKQKNRTQRSLRDSDAQSTIFFLEKMMSHHLDYHRTSNDKSSKEISNELVAANRYLDLSYYLWKLQYACELASRNQLTSEEHDLSTIKIIEQFLATKYLVFLQEDRQVKIDNHEFTELIPHQAYKMILRLIQKQEKDDFNKLFLFIRKYREYIANRDLLAIVMYLINFAILCIRNKNSIFYQKSFEIYDFAHKNKIFLKDGLIDVNSFSNAITSACTVKEFNWADDFVLYWKRYLHDDFRADTITLNRAKIFFEQKNYIETLKLLKNAHKFKRDYDKVRGRLMRVRTYWHYQNKYDELYVLDKLRNFESFLKRNSSIEENIKPGYLNFIKVFREILRKDKPKQEIVSMLKEFKFIVCKDWLVLALNNYKPFQ
jgi:hypothetical protein